MKPALTGYKNREEGMVVNNMLEESNKMGEGESEGGREQ